MDLEFKSDQDREAYLRDLGDPVLHFADEINTSDSADISEAEAPQVVVLPTEADIPTEVSEPVALTMAEAVSPAQILTQVPTPIEDVPQSVNSELGAELDHVEHTAQDVTPASEVAPEVEPPIAAPVPKSEPLASPDQVQPEAMVPPTESPAAVKRTKRWSKGMFAALMSRNDES